MAAEAKNGATAPSGPSTTVVAAPLDEEDMPEIKIGSVSKYSGEETGLKARQFIKTLELEFHYYN